MFNRDNLVVYPAHGVGIVESIEHKLVGDTVCDFYIVRIRANNIIMMVPVQNAVNVGLRPLIAKGAAISILEMLKLGTSGTVFTGQNWNRRFREYSMRLKSPDLSIVADVLHELLLIGRSKELSFGERRLLDQAMNLVGGELSEVLSLPPDDLRNDLLSLYAPFQPESEETEDA